MRVLVVSDTHVPTLARRLPQRIMDEARECEAIIHAGDLVSESVIDQLSSLSTVHAVQGNQDSPVVRDLVPARKVLEIEGRRVGIVHGHTGAGMYTEERALNSFPLERVDIIVFGHSHVPMNVHREGVLLFNPGSPVAGRSRMGNTYGILEIGPSFSARIFPVGDQGTLSG